MGQKGRITLQARLHEHTWPEKEPPREVFDLEGIGAGMKTSRLQVRPKGSKGSGKSNRDGGSVGHELDLVDSGVRPPQCTERRHQGVRQLLAGPLEAGVQRQAPLDLNDPVGAGRPKSQGRADDPESSSSSHP